MATLLRETLLLVLFDSLLSSAFAEHVADKDKIDCYPEKGNQTLCESRGCTWEETSAKVLNVILYLHYEESGLPHL